MKRTTKENLVAVGLGALGTAAAYVGFAYGAREQGMSVAFPHLTPSNEGMTVVAALSATTVGLAIGSSVKFMMKMSRLKSSQLR